MMKLRPTMQAMPDTPRMSPSIPFSGGQAMQPNMMQSLQSSPYDDRAVRNPGILGGQPAGQPNIYGGQGPANIVPDANGEIGRNSNGMRDTLTRLLMGGAGG